MELTFARGGVEAVLNPRAFFDISIGGEPAGRITVELRKVPTRGLMLLVYEALRY